jgi:hypothetical protein
MRANISLFEISQEIEPRCECGQLITTVSDQALALNCKRCMRRVAIPLSSREGWGTAIS